MCARLTCGLSLHSCRPACGNLPVGLEVVLMGHSIGASVSQSFAHFFETSGGAKVRGLIALDQRVRAGLDAVAEFPQF